MRLLPPQPAEHCCCQAGLHGRRHVQSLTKRIASLRMEQISTLPFCLLDLCSYCLIIAKPGSVSENVAQFRGSYRKKKKVLQNRLDHIISNFCESCFRGAAATSRARQNAGRAGQNAGRAGQNACWAQKGSNQDSKFGAGARLQRVLDVKIKKAEVKGTESSSQEVCFVHQKSNIPQTNIVWFWIILASKGSRQKEMLKSRRVFLTGEVNDDMAKAVIVVGIPFVPTQNHLIVSPIPLHWKETILGTNLYPFLRYPTFLQTTRQRDKGYVTHRQRYAWNPHVTLHMPSFTCHRQQVFVQQLLFLEAGYLDVIKDGETSTVQLKRGWSYLRLFLKFRKCLRHRFVGVCVGSITSFCEIRFASFPM